MEKVELEEGLEEEIGITEDSDEQEEADEKMPCFTIQIFIREIHPQSKL